jgi:hypothetical protein
MTEWAHFLQDLKFNRMISSTLNLRISTTVIPEHTESS